MTEIWKDIKGYEGLYQISNLGRVKVLQRIVFANGKKPYSVEENILNGSIENIGYRVFALYKNKIRKMFKAHRLIAIHFIPNLEGKKEVNHIDGNKLNNSIENLEWCTSKENANHAFGMGLRVNPKGELHGGAKLNEGKVLELKKKYTYDNTSFRKLAIEYGVSSSVIFKIIKGQAWSHVNV